MRLGKAVGILAGAILLGASLGVAGVLLAYLTEYGARRAVLAAGAALLGLGAAIAAGSLISYLCKSRKSALVAMGALAVLLLVPLGSAVYPGTVTAARFGLTVYGLIPIPTLDITVNSRGVLWFRDKGHAITMAEVQPLLSPGTEVLVIGNGWNGSARVDPEIVGPQGPEVHVLPTAAAFELYNRCRRQGRCVALLAHTTC